MAQKDGGSVGTSTLLRRLFRAPSLEAYLGQNAGSLWDESFSAYLGELCKQGGMIRNQVILRSGIDRCYGHQIFRGVRRPSRDIVIRLAFGLGLTVDDAQKLLTAAGKSPLFPRIKRDAAVLYCLNRRADVTQVQTLLEDLGLDLLEGEARNE